MSAFAAGNSVVLNPSEHTPNTSRLVKKIVEKVFPTEIMSVVEGDSKTASKLLEKKWDYIFFTGSVKIGEIVAMAAAKKLTPYTLELGGKSPAIINSDTDLKLASKRIVWGKFLNSGQTCVAPDYLVAHKSIKGTLIKELINRIEKTYKASGLGFLLIILSISSIFSKLKTGSIGPKISSFIISSSIFGLSIIVGDIYLLSLSYLPP